MLGDLLYEETGQVTGMEVLPPEDGAVVDAGSSRVLGQLQEDLEIDAAFCGDSRPDVETNANALVVDGGRRAAEVATGDAAGCNGNLFTRFWVSPNPSSLLPNRKTAKRRNLYCFSFN